MFYKQTVSGRYCSDILFKFIGQLTDAEITNSWFQHDGPTVQTTNRFCGHRDRQTESTGLLTLGCGITNSVSEQTIEQPQGDTYIRHISKDRLAEVFRIKVKRCQLCIKIRGDRFEHLF